MKQCDALKRFVVVSIFLSSLIYSQPVEYLLKTDADVMNNFNVVELIGDHALLVATERTLEELNRVGSPYVILDYNPRDKFYLFVFLNGEDLARVARFGTILDEYDECVLLRTTQDQVSELNRLKVELSRLTLKPVVKRDMTLHDFEDVSVTRDTLIEQMLDEVSPDSILNSVLRLQHFYTRYSTSDSNKIAAVNWIRDMLVAYGCDSVYTHEFSNVYGDNVVGIELGKRFTTAQKYVLIGGHLDDVPDSGYAPGADDNASGTAAMLEAARVMKDYEFAHTIRFVGFNAEEQGLIGSDSLASFANSHDDTIIAALCYDMIGYVTAPGLDSMRLRYTTAVPGCSVFACVFYQAVADTYTQLKIRHVRYSGTTGSSDHASFWRYGYVSTGGIERVLCPGYHTIGDTVGPTGFNNLDFATEVTRTAIAVLATLAIPMDTTSDIGEQFLSETASGFLIQPNPARHVVVSFAVEKDEAIIDLVVYDCIGRAVVRLATGLHRKGRYLVEWDGKNSLGSEEAPGVYFVTFWRDGEQQCRKVILTK